MKSLMFYARQVGQRRTTAFYLLPRPADPGASGQVQHFFAGYAKAEDRPRSLREMFSDAEYENEEEPGPDGDF